MSSFSPDSLTLSKDDHLLLLGSTGLFGHHLLPRVQASLDCHNHPLITLVTRCREKTLQKFPFLSSINIIETNFLESSTLDLSQAPTHVLHMANMSASDTFNGSSQYSKYLLLTNSVNALRGVVKPGTTKKVLFTSSGVAYGSSDSYSEDDYSIVNVFDSSYSLGFAKLNAEYLLSMLCSEIGASLSVCRCFSFISPFLPCDLHYALGNFVSCAVNYQDIVIKGDGLDCRSYQHVDDAIDWLLFLLHSDASVPLINFGSDHSISIRDLAFLVRDLVCPDISVSIINQPADPHNFRRINYVPMLSKSKELGLFNRRKLGPSILELSRSLSESLTK